eukprot:5732586-Pleurochrysis_carterae.AAC.2
MKDKGRAGDGGAGGRGVRVKMRKERRKEGPGSKKYQREGELPRSQKGIKQWQAGWGAAGPSAKIKMKSCGPSETDERSKHI